MANAELVKSLRGYFLATETSHPCEALPSSKYTTFRDLLDQALDDDPENALLWFWQGWNCQFFQRDSAFEWAEDAYERALSFNPKFAPAVLALTYLYWKTAFQRAKQQVMDQIFQQYQILSGKVLSQDDMLAFASAMSQLEETARTTVSFAPAISTLGRIDRRGIVQTLSEEDENCGDLLVWYQIFVEMSDDLGLAPMELSELHWEFAYAFFNTVGLSEMSTQVQQAFEAVRRLSGPSRYLADALAYLALANSEQNEESPNPKQAYALFHELLNLYEGYRNDPNTVQTEAFDEFGRFLSDFYEKNPVFCRDNPGKCIELFERSQRLGLFNTGWPDGVHAWAGHFYGELRRYEEAVAQFDLASAKLIEHSRFRRRFGQDYTLALARTKRVDKAIIYLERANDIDNDYDIETLLFLLRELRASKESSDLFVQSFVKELQKAPRISTITEMADKCRANWPEYWDTFPEALRRMIVTAEYAQQLVDDTGAWDFSMLGAQWGKIAEIALEFGFVRPFSDYVEQNGVQRVKSLPKGKYNPDEVWLSGPELSVEGLKREKQSVRIGLLWAASGDTNHPVAEMIRMLHLDPNLWCNQIPMQLKAINQLRNRFVHPNEIANADDVHELRSILVTGGLLFNLGQAMHTARQAR